MHTISSKAIKLYEFDNKSFKRVEKYKFPGHCNPGYFIRQPHKSPMKAREKWNDKKPREHYGSTAEENEGRKKSSLKLRIKKQ